jgi:hypothetical protein
VKDEELPEFIRTLEIVAEEMRHIARHLRLYGLRQDMPEMTTYTMEAQAVVYDLLRKDKVI